MDRMRMAIGPVERAAVEAGRQIVDPEWRIPNPEPGISEIERMGAAMARAWEEEG